MAVSSTRTCLITESTTMSSLLTRFVFYLRFLLLIGAFVAVDQSNANSPDYTAR